MLHADPTAIRSQGEAAAITVAVAVADAARLSPGEKWFIGTLRDNDRFRLTSVVECPATCRWPSGLARVLLSAEAALLRAHPDARGPAPARLSSTPGGGGVTVLDRDAVPRADVLIDFARSDSLSSLAGHFRHGIWRLGTAPALAGFHASRSGSDATVVSLTRQTDAEGPATVIGSARYGTKFLATRNAAFIEEKSVQLVARELARIALGHAPLAGQRAAPPPPPPLPPSPAQLVQYSARAGRQAAGRIADGVRGKLGQAPGLFQLALGRGTALDFDPATALRCALPAGRFWADPFFLRRADGLYLFFEDYDLQTRLGHIGVARVRDRTIEYIGPALKTDYHLSFPFVFAHGGDVFMLPETCSAQRLEIWRATEFPTRWERHGTALEGVRAADSVLCRQQDQWWLFTNICRDSFDDYCSELHLFRTDGPELGHLSPHPLNPVVIDSAGARGGGRVFSDRGRLLRASQNNTGGGYGHGLNLMEITRLDTEGYAERPVRRILPDFAPGLIGCHHVDFAEGLFVMDIRLKRYSASAGDR